ncbi:hypothetical protein C2S52_007053 [Perilla frutescens var. hirtella]|nr:hypothetical protein C2S52_007053 [Perilla frutescens var. hirtella]
MREIATTRKTLCHGDLHHRRITPVPSPRHGLAGDALRSLVTRFLLLSPTLLVPLASAVYGSRWPLRVRCKFALSFRRGSSEIPSENLALADSGGIIPFRNSPSLTAIAHAFYLLSPTHRTPSCTGLTSPSSSPSCFAASLCRLSPTKLTLLHSRCYSLSLPFVYMRSQCRCTHTVLSRVLSAVVS